MITDLFPPTLLAQLDKLGQLFVWRRKPLRDSIADALHSADTRHDALIQAHQNTQAHLEKLIQIHAQLTKQQAHTTAELENTRQALEFTRVELQACTEASESLQQSFDRHQQMYSELVEDFQSLQQCHGDTWTRFQLISQLLAARPQDSVGLTNFRELLVTDYMAFAESESSLAAEAKALALLQSIEQELALLVSFPDVRERTIVGIVGGFSSGKSEFINSFIDDPQVRLAVGLQPVTAIPSYVLTTGERMIRGYSANGGHIDLDVDFYKNVSHAFISAFSFDLKSLMPFMCIGVRMRHECFSDICFIDTPGYNAPSTAAEHSQEDRLTAVKFAQQANSILWLIGLDSNGTVPDSDLEFIQQISLEGRSVYVVLTKADLKTEDDIDDILEEVQDRLDDEGILIEGISAYSSTLREEVAYRKLPLLEHFASINRRGDTRKHLEKRLGEVFAMYEESIQTDIAALQAQKKAINGLGLDCLQFGGQNIYERMRDSIDKLTCNLDISPLETWLKESRRLHESFIEAVRQV